MTVRMYSEDDSRVVLNEIFWSVLSDMVPYDKSHGYLSLMSMDDVTDLFKGGKFRYVYVPASDVEEQEARENGSEFSPGKQVESETWLYDVLNTVYVGDEDTPQFDVPNDLLTVIERLELELFEWLDVPYAEDRGAKAIDDILGGMEEDFERGFNLMIGRVLIQTYVREQTDRWDEICELLKKHAAF